MLGALLLWHQQTQTAIQAIEELTQEAGKPRWNWQAPAINQALFEQGKSEFGAALADAYTITNKQERNTKVGQLRRACVDKITNEDTGGRQVAGTLVELERITV